MSEHESEVLITEFEPLPECGPAPLSVFVLGGTAEQRAVLVRGLATTAPLFVPPPRLYCSDDDPGGLRFRTLSSHYAGPAPVAAPSPERGEGCTPARDTEDGVRGHGPSNDDDDTPSLGPCCLCGGPGASNIVMLNRRAAIPGHGWGCVQCGLPSNGAVAVLCEACAMDWHRHPGALTHCCRGYPASEGRIAIAELPNGPFDHDLTQHPEFAALA